MAWLEALPAVIQELEHRWKLTPDGPLSAEEPSCSYVEAVRRPDGTPAVLKISMPHMEQEHELTVSAFGTETRPCGCWRVTMSSTRCFWSVVSRE
jgi:hypothetical protein